MYANSNSGTLNSSKEMNIAKYPSQFRVLANKFAHEKNVKARRALLDMFGCHLVNFKRSILINRRRWQQRMRRRQEFLRSFFMQHLLELETSFLELIPIPRKNSIPLQIEPPQNEQFQALCHINRLYKDVMGLESDEDWLSNFHMTKSTFGWLCDQLKEILQPVGKNYFRKDMSHEKQVALGLHAFATGAIFSIPTVCKFMKFFAEAIIKKLGKQFFTMPATEEDIDEIGNAFHLASNMPPAVIGVLGVLELATKTAKQVSNISIKSENNSIIMQMLIDNKLLFRKVRLNSNQPTLFIEETNEITNLPKKLINKQSISRFIVTPDTYYPLRKWLMHKYRDPVEPHEFDFNEAVDNLFVFRDRALKRLFARWRILKSNSDLDSRTMEKVSLACCVLHNVLQINEESYDENWAKWLNMDTTKFTISPRFKPVLNVLQGRSYSWESEDAAEVREFLGRTISSTEM